MKLVRFIFVLMMLAGCCSSDIAPSPLAYKIVHNMPRKWEAPVLYVRLPEEVREGAFDIDMAKELCKELAIRLYDAFDGQVYIAEFVIVNPSLRGEREEGTCTLFKTGSILYHNESYVGDPPMHPGRFYCTIPAGANYVAWCAGTMLHEWLHTFIGLGDEYKHAGDPGSDMNTSCPLNPNSEKNLEENSCVMYLSRSRRELCRPQNHNPDTDQGKEACYTKAARVLFENQLAFIRVPTKVMKGPLDAPTPKITVRLK